MGLEPTHHLSTMNGLANRRSTIMTYSSKMHRYHKDLILATEHGTTSCNLLPYLGSLTRIELVTREPQSPILPLNYKLHKNHILLM